MQFLFFLWWGPPYREHCQFKNLNLIKNGLCELKNETVILSSKGSELQEKMNIFTKVHNQIKVEGNEANTLIDSALDKLGEL